VNGQQRMVVCLATMLINKALNKKWGVVL